jgi:uncharacterized membrane protein
MADLLLFLSSFLACSVEMVEAMTIVLAVGVTRGWRAAAWGVGAALGALAAIVAVLGPAITRLPIDAIRTFVGALLLIFGLQWLRKAILRASGRKALHDEDAIFAAEVRDLERAVGRDWYAFTVAFKGVFLEGLEVAFLVVTFGGSRHNVPLAAAGAAAALIVVATAAVIVHAPLSRVPENTLKFGVGTMLTAFGIFWSGEGVGIGWPGADAALPVLVLVVLGGALALVRVARGRATRPAPAT